MGIRCGQECELYREGEVAFARRFFVPTGWWTTLSAFWVPNPREQSRVHGQWPRLRILVS
jgi:hypothetical protein